MCTLIVATRRWTDTSLIVAANRDEKLDRPSLAPHWIEYEGTGIFAPRDALQGGTWLGLNQHGVFAAVTNRFGDPADPARRSRGLLVMDALKHQTAERSFEGFGRLEGGVHNPFHLVIADQTGAFLVVDHGSGIDACALEPGIHAFTERSLRGRVVPREDYLFNELTREMSQSPPSIDGWSRILSHHDDQDLSRSLCVHFEAVGYGTRSSTIVEMKKTGTRFLFAEGSPCRASYSDFSHLLAAGPPASAS